MLYISIERYTSYKFVIIICQYGNRWPKKRAMNKFKTRYFQNWITGEPVSRDKKKKNISFISDMVLEKNWWVGWALFKKVLNKFYWTHIFFLWWNSLYFRIFDWSKYQHNTPWEEMEEHAASGEILWQKLTKKEENKM